MNIVAAIAVFVFALVILWRALINWTHAAMIRIAATNSNLAYRRVAVRAMLYTTLAIAGFVGSGMLL